MKTRILISIIFVFASVIMIAQTKGNGNVVKENRNVENFASIKLTSTADLIISQGPSSVVVETDENIIDQIKTTVENGVLKIWYKGKGYRSVHGPVVYVTVPSLDKILSLGAGDITFTDVFKTNNLYLSINGSGDVEGNFEVENFELKVNGSGDCDINGIMGMFKVTIAGSGDVNAEGLKLNECFVKNMGSGDLSLKGKANTLTVSQLGSGDLDASRLTAVNAKVSNSGSSDISLNVVESLDVTLNGSGDLVYKGDPEKVNVRTNGSGEVYKR